jgi:predicted dehydrogenase
VLPKDPGLLDPDVRHYAHLPGGHQEGWADAFSNIMGDIYSTIRDGKVKPGQPTPPAFATFEDGYRANAIVDAILKSARGGSIWTKVEY